MARSVNLFNLSYIITTRNRLAFLKITLENLIATLKQDEEIVVVDANSTDGAKEYLQQLFEQGKIHQFISEPDHNQAHGWNKAILMARGNIIKKIIDDDVHSYTAIRKCKDFMLNNPRVEICISNCLTADLAAPKNIQIASRLKYYMDWKAGKTPCFTFSDVYMLIRSSSLSHLGLFDTQFAMMDWEYSLRCTYLKANIAYYTGYNALAVSTQGNVTSSTDAARLKKEELIGKAKYGYKGDRSDISVFSEFKIAVGKAVNYKRGNFSHKVKQPELATTENLDTLYNSLYNLIEDYNKSEEFAFIL